MLSIFGKRVIACCTPSANLLKIRLVITVCLIDNSIPKEELMKARIAIAALALLSLCSVVSTKGQRKDLTTAASFGTGGGLPTPCQMPPAAAEDGNCPFPPASAK